MMMPTMTEVRQTRERERGWPQSIMLRSHTHRLYLFITGSSPSPSAMRSRDDDKVDGGVNRVDDADGAKALHDVSRVTAATTATEATTAVTKRMMDSSNSIKEY